jgi:putative ABC transport system substrate-binding protein
MRWVRNLLVALAATVAVTGPAALAQIDKVRQIGFVEGMVGGPEDEAFRERLHALGWIDGRNLVIGYYLPQGTKELLVAQIAELVRLGVEVIALGSSVYVEAAREATSTLPIVFCAHGDPVGTGHVASLARPGGNLTGISNLLTELSAKELELLTQVAPAARRIAALWNPATPSHRSAMQAVEVAARSLGVELRWVSASTVGEFDAAFAAMTDEHVEAVLVLQSGLFNNNSARLAALALQYHLPNMMGVRKSVEAGALLSYGADLTEMWRRCADYVDKILKGANPAELPVEQTSKYELAINLRTAKALGLTIPLTILAGADEVIE